MGKIQILDCTLRDGGYLNDWNFGHSNLVSILERLVEANIDIVEIGFLDERRPFDINRSIMPKVSNIEKIWGNIIKYPPKLVAMIDYGTFDINNIPNCEDSLLDGIRIIFKKDNIMSALEYSKTLKQLGYQVFVQLVSITSYTESELIDACNYINDFEPYAVSIVDTYGLLDYKNLAEYIRILNDNLKERIVIGFHGHNNFQLAFANSIFFIENCINRDVVIDGTLFGMGKSAGNTPIELLATYLNDNNDAKYKNGIMLEAIEESLKPFFQNNPWGYKTFFYLSAVNQCHPSYVEYFQSKGNLSSTKINDILSKVPMFARLSYDKEIAEKIYQSYLIENLNEIDNYDLLYTLLKEKNILLIGPGKNVKLQRKKVDSFINLAKPFIIAINYVPSQISIDGVFITKMNRQLEMSEELIDLDNIKLIATTNLECKSKKFDYIFSRENLIEEKEEIKDNSFLMFLKILKTCGVEMNKIFCAGFDGYSDKEDNYLYPGMEYSFVKSMSNHLNRHIKEVIENEYCGINFITYTHYTADEDVNSAAF